MHISDTGSGEVVLLLHGSPGTAAYFAPLVERLSRDHRVLVPDLPGYGASPPLDGVYTMARATRVLEDELLRRGVRETAVVGEGIGGYRAFALALSGRVRVTSLVTLGSFAGLSEDERITFRGSAELWRQQTVDLRPLWMERVFSPGFAASHPEEATQVAAWLDGVPREALAAEMEAIADAEDLMPRLGSLAIPILARVGEQDGTNPPFWSEAIVARAPNARLEVVPGCGHALLVEDWRETVDSVAQALGPGEHRRARLA